MRKRYCCQVVLVLALVLFLKHQLFGAQSFSALQPSELEKKLSDGERICLEGRIFRKIQSGEEFVFILKTSLQEQVLIYLEECKDSKILKTGQNVKVSGTVSFFQTSPNPGNFNQYFFYKKQNIHFQLRKAILKEYTHTQDFT